jgi:hypothetical protein
MYLVSFLVSCISMLVLTSRHRMWRLSAGCGLVSCLVSLCSSSLPDTVYGDYLVAAVLCLYVSLDFQIPYVVTTCGLRSCISMFVMTSRYRMWRLPAGCGLVSLCLSWLPYTVCEDYLLAAVLYRVLCLVSLCLSWLPDTVCGDYLLAAVLYRVLCLVSLC